MSNTPVPQPPKLEDIQGFRDWSTYVKAQKDVAEFPERRALEAQKLSSEFSKLVIINLQFINAGSLLAVPTLANSTLGLSNLTRYDKLYYLGIPMGMFAFALVLASVASFSAYCNYEAIAGHWSALRDWREFDLARHNPHLEPRPWDEMKRSAERRQKKLGRKATFWRWFGLGSGWSSVLFFIASCGFLALNVH